MTDTQTPELSRPLPLEAVDANTTIERTVEAAMDECEALRTRLGLEGVSDLRAELSVDRAADEGILVRGHVSADVVQTCVVTLEPFPAHIEDDFEIRFTTRRGDGLADLDIGPEDDDPPESLGGDMLDLGEIVVQQLALALDPYPRIPGAELPKEGKYDASSDGPFAVLARLKAQKSGENK